MDAHIVLLVDDDHDSLEIYSLILAHHRFHVLCARTADEGFALACDGHPQLVVTELGLFTHGAPSMPDRLRADPRTARLPIIGMTALPSFAVTAAPGLAACDSYLQKPCVPSRLLQEVERFLSPQLAALL